jgi:ADP-ribosylglycohydrolase
LIHRGFPLEAAGAIAAAVAEAMGSGATRESVLAAATAHLPPDSEMIVAIESSASLARSCTSYDEFRERFYATLLRPWPHRHAGWSIAVDPRESIPAALGIFYVAEGDPRETILGCANFGRDADTIATIGGAIAGALRGASAIPADWIAAVCAASPVDQDALAQDLLGVLRRRAERAAAWGAGVLMNINN